MAKNKNKNQKKNDKIKPVNKAKSIFKTVGYSIGIGEMWISVAIVAVINLALVFWGVTGLIGSISLFAHHSPLQAFLYLGTGLLALGLIFPLFCGFSALLKNIKAASKMLSEKIKLLSGEATK